jgi:hypothetical protein
LLVIVAILTGLVLIVASMHGLGVDAALKAPQPA